MCFNEEIDRLTNRHIAKLLSRLGDTIAPCQEADIKRQFRFFADDIKEAEATNDTGKIVNKGGNR